MAVNYEALRRIMSEGLDRTLREESERDTMKWLERSKGEQALTYEMLRQKEFEMRRKMELAGQRSKREEMDMLRRYMNMQPVMNPSTDNRLMPTYDSDVGVWAITKVEEPAPSPRADLEQRCLDKGLDPNFARELDLD